MPADLTDPVLDGPFDPPERHDEVLPRRSERMGAARSPHQRVVGAGRPSAVVAVADPVAPVRP